MKQSTTIEERSELKDKTAGIKEMISYLIIYIP
uniref:Uncharacterized protein n=1 Tax=Arundo donax TaxID=35708 RepID=A0A0A9F6J7_ARUDO